MEAPSPGRVDLQKEVSVESEEGEDKKQKDEEILKRWILGSFKYVVVCALFRTATNVARKKANTCVRIFDFC